MPSLTPEELVAVATTMGLIAKYPPSDDHWNHDGRHGPKLINKLNEWLKEQL